MATARDYYDILGVSKSATAAEIKRAYRKMALQYHPDQNKSADAHTKFAEINEAYEVLSDERKRQQYDQLGHAAFSGGAAGGAPGAGGGAAGQWGPFTYTYQGGGSQDFDFGGFSDPFSIFEQFFGGGFTGSAKRAPRYSMRLTFREAVFGTEKTVTVDGKTITVKVPAGVDNGTRVRFGDFDVVFEVTPDARFERDGADLHVEQPISFTKAVLGGTIEVPTLEGSLKVRVQPGTKSGTVVRLSGKGVTVVQGRRRGDLYIHFVIRIPSKLSSKGKKLLEELEGEL